MPVIHPSGIDATMKGREPANSHVTQKRPYSFDRDTFDNIHLDLSKQAGKCRFADSGIAWKPSGGGETWAFDKDKIVNASWSKAARGYELKITSRSQPTIVQLDGFALEDQDKIGKIFKNWYGRPFEVKEHSLRGYNWGKLELKDNEMSFNVHNRPAFEIPYTEVMNTNLTGKNEVAIELSLEESSVAPPVQDENGVNGDAPHIEKRGKKAAAGIDQLVEMRFYVPGTTQRDKESDDEEDVIDEDGKVEEDAATIFYNTLLKKAEIGEVAGNTIASFNDVLHLTPRGRFEVDMYETSFRLRGKTYDYKVDYDSVKKFMLLPKADEVHMLVTIGLDPPLRQGQTRYPFLVMQYKRDEEMELEINLSEEVLEKQYKGSLHKRYEAPIASIFASVFRALTGRKMISPSKEYSSVHNQSCLKCSIKANEGFLYILDRSFIFIPKPATYIAFDTIANVTFSRVGGALAASRTFDVAIKLKDGRGEHQFSNVNREEQNALEDFLKRKGIKVKNEMMEDVHSGLAKALADDSGSEDEVVGVDRGSADEDDESVDDDFQGDSDSDVAEEFDSQHASSGSDDDDMEVDEEEVERVEPAKKKQKTAAEPAKKAKGMAERPKKSKK